MKGYTLSVGLMMAIMLGLPTVSAEIPLQSETPCTQSLIVEIIDNQSISLDYGNLKEYDDCSLIGEETEFMLFYDDGYQIISSQLSSAGNFPIIVNQLFFNQFGNYFICPIYSTYPTHGLGCSLPFSPLNPTIPTSDCSLVGSTELYTASTMGALALYGMSNTHRNNPVPKWNRECLFPIYNQIANQSARYGIDVNKDDLTNEGVPNNMSFSEVWQVASVIRGIDHGGTFTHLDTNIYSISDNFLTDESNWYSSYQNLTYSPSYQGRNMNLGKWQYLEQHFLHKYYDSMNSNKTISLKSNSFFKESEFNGIYDATIPPNSPPLPQLPSSYQSLPRSKAIQVSIVGGDNLSTPGNCDELFMSVNSNINPGALIMRGKMNNGEHDLKNYRTTSDWHSYYSWIDLNLTSRFNTSTNYYSSPNGCYDIGDGERTITTYVRINIMFYDGTNTVNPDNYRPKTQNDCKKTGVTYSIPPQSPKPNCKEPMAIIVAGGAEGFREVFHYQNQSTHSAVNHISGESQKYYVLIDVAANLYGEGRVLDSETVYFSYIVYVI